MYIILSISCGKDGNINGVVLQFDTFLTKYKSTLKYF